MRFSVIGDLPDAALFIKSIVDSSEHTLGAVHLHGALEDYLQPRFPPNARRVSTPEDVLIAADTDAVIVAESQHDDSMRLVRQASQADCHVVVIPPQELSTAYSYEIHLLLDESRCGIVVLTGGWYLPAELAAWTPVIDCQLGLPSISGDPATANTLMHAIDASAAMGFANSQVTVLGINNDRLPDDNCRIVLAGCGADGRTRPAMTLNCSHAADHGCVQGRSSEQSINERIVLPGLTDVLPGDVAMSLSTIVVQRLTDAAACQIAMEQFSRTLQVVSAVDKSIRRRRTVDVYVDELTERSVFKTQMTAIGCGLLTWLMLGMIGYLLIGQLLKPAAIVMQVMRALWIAPVVIFLLTQFLLPIARGRQRDDASS